MIPFASIASALIVALSLALASCTKQDQPLEPAKANTPLTSADCDSLPDPRPLDDSPAAKARAVNEGLSSRAACKKAVAALQSKDKPDSDVARIREIMEKQEAERAAQEQRSQQHRAAIKEGGAKPLREFKY